MNPSAIIAIGALLLFIVLLGCLALGRRVRDKLNSAVNTPIENAMLGLLALILSFSFSMAAGHLDARRKAALDEANAAGTAALRLSALPDNDQPVIKDLVGRFIDARIQFGKDLELGLDPSDADRASTELQGKIWPLAVKAAESRDSTRMLVLPSLNEMFDAASARSVTSQASLPGLVVALMIGLALLSGLLAGRITVGDSRALKIFFAAMVSLTIFVILDLDNPRAGLIRLGHADQLLQSAKAGL